MDRESREGRWRAARLGTDVALGLSLVGVAAVALLGQKANLLLRLDAAGSVMLLLIAFLGRTIVGWSFRQLRGEPGQERYLAALCGTLVSAALVACANHLVLLGLAWLATSLFLHRLLTFYPDRPGALLAAHKKFLASRLADACFAGAVLCVLAGAGTLRIDELLSRLAASPEMGARPELQAAALLLAATALLKSAQLPAHGWILQVMEAPTPVSALLHAGVVNLGGFVLLRLGGLVMASPSAQVVLVASGCLTAVVASLVMQTRVSVKVALAWSTCAQMGFLLVECGLGAFQLALVHLVGHSLYKAYAFLHSAGAVAEVRRARLLPAEAPRGLAARLLGVVWGAGAVGLCAAALGVRLLDQPVALCFAWVLALALAPLLPVRGLSGATRLVPPLLTLGVAGSALGLHALSSRWLALPEAHVPALLPATAAAAFTLLYLLQSVIAAFPRGALSRRLWPACFAGFYLDEWFTRLTFNLWPQPRPRTEGAQS